MLSVIDSLKQANGFNNSVQIHTNINQGVTQCVQFNPSCTVENVDTYKFLSYLRNIFIHININISNRSRTRSYQKKYKDIGLY